MASSWNRDMRVPGARQCPECMEWDCNQDAMGVEMFVPAQVWFCSVVCMHRWASWQHNVCRRAVQVWNGAAMVPCQGCDGDVRCPECECQGRGHDSHSEDF